ncbi:hypothetical protein AO375_1152 [Moraxella catarrhalis]|nr:hypothetical protein AO378_0153 [Moraxella catarrhalis]OAV14310.1 hypothetical protein AO375_1152 [Moraxella catarrhalis]
MIYRTVNKIFGFFKLKYLPNLTFWLTFTQYKFGCRKFLIHFYTLFLEILKIKFG